MCCRSVDDDRNTSSGLCNGIIVDERCWMIDWNQLRMVAVNSGRRAYDFAAVPCVCVEVAVAPSIWPWLLETTVDDESRVLRYRPWL